MSCYSKCRTLYIVHDVLDSLASVSCVCQLINMWNGWPTNCPQMTRSCKGCFSFLQHKQVHCTDFAQIVINGRWAAGLHLSATWRRGWYLCAGSFNPQWESRLWTHQSRIPAESVKSSALMLVPTCFAIRKTTPAVSVSVKSHNTSAFRNLLWTKPILKILWIPAFDFFSCGNESASTFLKMCCEVQKGF